LSSYASAKEPDKCVVLNVDHDRYAQDPPSLVRNPLVLLAGCTEFMEGYNDAKLHAGEPGYSFSERLARVGDDAVQTAAGAADAYARVFAIF
jgi:hypothetical protein